MFQCLIPTVIFVQGLLVASNQPIDEFLGIGYEAGIVVEIQHIESSRTILQCLCEIYGDSVCSKQVTVVCEYLSAT